MSNHIEARMRRDEFSAAIDEASSRSRFARDWPDPIIWQDNNGDSIEVCLLDRLEQIFQRWSNPRVECSFVNAPKWMDKPDQPGFWWLNNNGRMSVKEVKAGKTCLVVGYCNVDKYLGTWQRIVEPEGETPK